jgi:hypothetical protein
MLLTFSHLPLSLSFHSVTLLSPVLTARTLPLRLQLTRQATASKLSVVGFQSPVGMLALVLTRNSTRSDHTGDIVAHQRPNLNRLILTCTRNITLTQNRRRPRNIPDPIRVLGSRAFAQRLHAIVAPCLRTPIPNLDLTVAASRHEPAQSTEALSRRARSLCTRNRARRHRRRPTHGIDADTVRREHQTRPLVILEFQHANIAVAAGACENAAAFVRRPVNEVDAGGVLREVEGFCPGAWRRFAPDDDAAVVGGGGKEGAKFGVRPGDAPDGAFVAFERLDEPVRFVLDFENFDGAVGGAGCEAPAVVVEDGVVLGGGCQSCWLWEMLLSCWRQLCALKVKGRTIMSSWPELEITCACAMSAIGPLRQGGI